MTAVLYIVLLLSQTYGNCLSNPSEGIFDISKSVKSLFICSCAIVTLYELFKHIIEAAGGVVRTLVRGLGSTC